MPRARKTAVIQLFLIDVMRSPTALPKTYASGPKGWPSGPSRRYSKIALSVVPTGTLRCSAVLVFAARKITVCRIWPDGVVVSRMSFHWRLSNSPTRDRRRDRRPHHIPQMRTRARQQPRFFGRIEQPPIALGFFGQLHDGQPVAPERAGIEERRLISFANSASNWTAGTPSQENGRDVSPTGRSGLAQELS